MNSQEKSDLINHLCYYIKNEKEGYKYFIQKWNQLNEEDVNSLKEPLLVMCYKEMQKDAFLSPAYFEFQSVIKFFQDELNDYIPETNKFSLSNGANQKSIVKVFMELKSRGYIHNTNEEIAKLVSIVFNIKYDTALKYLENPNTMGKTKDLLN